MMRFSDQDRETLQQAFQTTKHWKVHAVYLRATGRSRQEVADLFLITPTTVTNSCKLYQKQGLEGLLSKNYKGRRPWLTPQQEAQLREFLDTSYVQGKTLQAYLREQFQRKYSLWGALKLAHRLGYVSKKRNVGRAKPIQRNKPPLSRLTERFAPSCPPAKPSGSSTSRALSTTAAQPGV